MFCVLGASESSAQHDPGTPDSVILEQLAYEVSGPPYQGTAVLPVRAVHDEYLALMYIPLVWSGPLLGDSGRFAGERLPYISYGDIGMGPKSGWIGISTPAGDPFLPPGQDTIAYLYFTVEDTGFVSVDTTSGGPAENYLHFFDSTMNKIEPFIERPRVYHVIPPYLPGDVNYDWEIDLGDVVYLINYLYKGMDPPEFFELGDVNGDCVTDIGDAVFLINYLYKDGPEPDDCCTF